MIITELRQQLLNSAVLDQYKYADKVKNPSL
jgi:hypothetical protein